MNLLRQCTFVDRYRNSLVELDDIIEENYNKYKTNEDEYVFYVLLYFTANWLPEASNKNLNKKLAEFYSSSNRKHNNFELIFISSDKTKDSYNEFLNLNKYIRYSLAYQEQELKSQLCKYLNINGIPYLTVARLKLKSSLNVVDFDTDRTNIKQQFLCDESGDDFPWSNKFKAKTLEPNDIQPNETESDLSMQLKNYKPYKLLSEVLDNLIMINRIFPHSTKLSQKLIAKTKQPPINKTGYKFLFMIFGSNDSPLNKPVIENLIEFWKTFHLKHKFLVVYLNFDRSDMILNEFPIIPWYTILSKELKVRLCENYGVKSVPKLIILDMLTGDLLNNNLRLGIIRFVHNFCNRQIETAKQKEKKPETKELIQENETFHFNFDFDMYDIYKNSKSKPRSKKTNKAKAFDLEFLRELNQNLIDLETKKLVNVADQYENGTNTFYLLYFCSNYTASNASIFENVLKFLNYMKEKIECNIKIVLVSSDQSETDYYKLLSKCEAKNKMIDDDMSVTSGQASLNKEFMRLALSFDCKKIKENLFRKLHVVGIPWFSLINASSGEILCQDLKIFILNSQLREMIF